MYTKIIVCVDGSETFNRALGEAVKLAKEQHAQLRLVHVCEGPAALPHNRNAHFRRATMKG